MATKYGGEQFGGKNDQYLPPGAWNATPGNYGGQVFAPTGTPSPGSMLNRNTLIQANDAEGNPFRQFYTGGAAERFAAGNFDPGRNQAEWDANLSDMRHRQNAQYIRQGGPAPVPPGYPGQPLGPGNTGGQYTPANQPAMWTPAQGNGQGTPGYSAWAGATGTGQYMGPQTGAKGQTSPYGGGVDPRMFPNGGFNEGAMGRPTGATNMGGASNYWTPQRMAAAQGMQGFDSGYGGGYQPSTNWMLNSPQGMALFGNAASSMQYLPYGQQRNQVAQQYHPPGYGQTPQQYAGAFGPGGGGGPDQNTAVTQMGGGWGAGGNKFGSASDDFSNFGASLGGRGDQGNAMRSLIDISGGPGGKSTARLNLGQAGFQDRFNQFSPQDQQMLQNYVSGFNQRWGGAPAAAPTPTPAPTPQPEPGRLERSRAAMQQARQSGNMERYNQIYQNRQQVKQNRGLPGQGAAPDMGTLPGQLGMPTRQTPAPWDQRQQMLAGKIYKQSMAGNDERAAMLDERRQGIRQRHGMPSEVGYD